MHYNKTRGICQLVDLFARQLGSALRSWVLSKNWLALVLEVNFVHDGTRWGIEDDPETQHA